jgi:hypothetical protein
MDCLQITDDVLQLLIKFYNMNHEVKGRLSFYTYDKLLDKISKPPTRVTKQYNGYLLLWRFTRCTSLTLEIYNDKPIEFRYCNMGYH